MGWELEPHIGKKVTILDREYLIEGATSWSDQYVELTTTDDETLIIRSLGLVLAHLSSQ